MKFERGGPTGSTEAGELVIENDRLKTTIMVLQQKLKVQDDTEGTNNRLQAEVREHEETVELLKNQVEELTAEVSLLKSKLEVNANKYNSTINTTVSENDRKYADLQKQFAAKVNILEKQMREQAQIHESTMNAM